MIYDDEKNAKLKELDYLEKTINKLHKKAARSDIFFGMGILIIILGVIYFAMNPDLPGGSLSLIVIGVGICVYNRIVKKQSNQRAIELNKDYVKEKKKLEEVK